MGSSIFFDNLLKRNGATNAFFSAFADKSIQFELNNIISLYTFGDQVMKQCDYIKDYNLFIELIDQVKNQGQTRLYDAMDIAVKSLLEVKQQYPNIILRIIAMTDGEDNLSKATAEQVAEQLIKNKIVVDSFVVSKNCKALKNITQASGGRCYCPESLSQGMELFEVETILSISKRGAVKFPELTGPIDLKKYDNEPFCTEGVKVTQPKQAEQKVQTASQPNPQSNATNVSSSNN